jgi:hypothetical protein
MNEVLESEKYFVVRNFISEEVLELAKNYYGIKFFIQKDFETRVASIATEENDIVAPFSISSYADAFTESLLIQLLPKMRDITKVPNLEPTYSFVRLYETGQWLGQHNDRPSCQYSITLPLVSYDDTPWVIFMENNEIDLNLGDMVIYKGCEAQHWREPYQGTWQVQAHLHYVDADAPAYKPYVNDGRPSLGMKK